MDARSSAESGIEADDLVASCGGVRLGELPPDTSMFAPSAPFDELDLARLEGEDELRVTSTEGVLTFARISRPGSSWESDEG